MAFLMVVLINGFGSPGEETLKGDLGVEAGELLSGAACQVELERI